MSRTGTTLITWTPEDGATLSVSSTATPWLAGDWVEVLASAPANTFIAAVQIHTVAVTYAHHEFEFGVGAEGAEVPIGILPGTPYASTNNGPQVFRAPVPWRVTTAAGVRLAIRTRCGHNSPQTLAIRVGYYAALDATTQTDELPFALPVSGRIVLVPTGSDWGDTAYQTLTASLDSAAAVAALMVTHQGGSVAAWDDEFDLATGSAGAESVVATFRMANYQYESNGEYFAQLPALLPIPASTRLAVRMRRAGTSTNNVYFRALLYGGEAPPEPPPTEYEPDPDIDVSGETIGLTWVELTDADDALHVWSKIQLPDPADYYGGDKDAWITGWGRISRALSDRMGQYEGTRFTWTLSDTDRVLRGLLNAAATKYLLNRSCVIRMISDAARRARQLARTIVRGVVRRYKPVSPLLFEITAEDILAPNFRAGNDERQIPRRTITVTDFPGAALADVNGTVDLPCVGQPVPIIYGEVSDANVSTTAGTALTTPTGIHAHVVGGTAGVTKRYALTLGNADYAVPLGAWADHRGETDPAWITVENAPTDEDMRSDPANHYLYIAIDDQVGATRGRAYGRYPNSEAYGLDGLDAPGAFGVVPDDEWQYWEARRPYGAADWNTQKRAGVPPTTNNTGGASVDTGKGAIKPIYVGLRDGHHCWLVAGHACTAILGWYVDGVRQPEATAGSGVAWLIPGFQGWTDDYGASTYRDLNGRRYTLIYGRIGYSDPEDCASGEKTLTVNVQGIESEGDGTGALIESLLEQYRHFVINWGFGDYQSGAWLEAPLFPTDPEPEADDVLHQVDTASFDTADAVSATRLAEGSPGSPATGYTGGGVIGGEGEFITLRECLARWNLSCDVRCGFNRRTQFFVVMFSDAAALLTAAREYTQERDIVAGSFDIEDLEAELFNARPYAFARRYADGTWGTEAETADATSITNYGETKRGPVLELWFVRTAAVAEDIMARVLARTADPPRRVAFTVGLSGLSTELGDIVTVTHADGIGAAGWSKQPLFVVRHEVDPEAFQVTLEADDVGRFFES